MSRIMKCEDIKIVKKCESIKRSSEHNSDQIACNEFIFGQNFLEEVNEAVLYVDPSIKIDKNVPDEKPSMKPPPICFHEVPRCLKDQISLPIGNIEELSFYETFLISEGAQNVEKFAVDILHDFENYKELGSATVMVEELSDGNILVFVTQQVFINGQRLCNECLSVVTKDLNLIHEKIIQKKCTKDTFMEKSLFIMSNDNGFRLVKKITRDDFTEEFKADVEWTKSGDFLSFGANILLMRKLVMEKFKGCVQSYGCNIDGEFSLCQHWFHKSEYKLFNNKPFETKRIDQLMIFKDDKIEKITTFFNLKTARMLKEMNNSNNYFIYMNPLNVQQKYTKDLKENWENDIQLWSAYLQFKANRKEELKKKFESAHMKFVLKDYIKSLIKCKPQNIMNFTMDFICKLEQDCKVDAQVQIFETVNRRNQQN
ncbi:hypothetical protein PVAND_004982 [Polypedilum vanderplanki]|uniref:Ciliogenesis-associated TTC17-interacting protein N-terminal domain-containing protein n=1 Tax=Polypedilum vanderplanki TaxID=319348 RepID=A0A9J6BZQ0_POLVA|nr:hypothetical protein PVAND_004982 [Polypedilum vanderplanki]